MRYECGVCGHIYDEQSESVPFEDLSDGWSCPICDADGLFFKQMKEPTAKPKKKTETKQTTAISAHERLSDLSYPSGFERADDAQEPHMDTIHEMAKSGQSVIEPMHSKSPKVSWDDILILGGQLNKMMRDEHAPVKTTTVIGTRAQKPLVIEHPVFITHMSFGALSREFKLSLSKGSAAVKTAMCSGEGGILPESMEAAHKFIFEYVPNLYSVTDDNLKKADAIEIKIGQGTKPGMGGHLPGSKVTEEIAQIRGKTQGEDIISPSRIEGVGDADGLKRLVDSLRERSEGRPIGVKIAAGHIEDDLAVIDFANPDYVTIDGRNGATGASPKIIKDATTIPTIFALHRARTYMDENDMDMQLVITGGLRVSSDFAKALAMGADAIAIGTAAMMAAACQQYRVCHTGKCPVGVATQDPDLRARLSGDRAAMRLTNFLEATREELKTFARITGNDDVHALSVADLCTISSEISQNTNIRHS